MSMRILSTVCLLGCLSLSVQAVITEQQAQQLGAQLTPLGGLQAGDEQLGIPAWDGGIKEAPAAYQAGDHHPDPYADEKATVIIDARNMSEYADKLTAGAQALFKAYPDSYKMRIFPTHRSASAPQAVYDATKKNALTATLTADGNGVDQTIGVSPFPIPENGLQVIWNHILRYRGVHIKQTVAQAALTRSGDYNLVELDMDLYVRYAETDMTADKLNNISLYFKQKVLSPARLAGNILLVHETINQHDEPRKAWTYNPGQRRVRRAPTKYRRNGTLQPL